MAARGALDAGGTTVIVWTLVHAIIHQTRAKKKSKWIKIAGLTFRHVDASRASDRRRRFILLESSDGCDPGDRGAQGGPRSDRPSF